MSLVGIGRYLFPLSSLLFGSILLFTTLFLVPLTCPSTIIPATQIESQPGLVALNGFVLDLSHATYPPTVALRDQFQGMDISPLVPRILFLGRVPTSSVPSSFFYPDSDVNACIADPLVADAWLKQTLSDTVNSLYTLNNSGLPDKCPAPRPVGVRLTETRLIANARALISDTRLKPPESFPDAYVNSPNLEQLKLSIQSPNLSFPCVTDPLVIKDLYRFIIGHIQVTNESIGLVAKGNPFKLTSAATEQQSPTTIWGGMVWIENQLFDVAQYLRVATTRSVSSAPNSLSVGSAFVREGDTMFLPKDLTEFLLNRAGHPNINVLGLPKSIPLVDRQLYLKCLLKLFYVGQRPAYGFHSQLFSLKCWLQNPIVLAFSLLAAFIILVQSLTATFTSFTMLFNATPKVHKTESNADTNHSLFLLTLLAEPASVVKQSILSITRAECANKVLVMVCDGNVRAKGQVKDTWQVVLDTLQYKPKPSAQHTSPYVYTSLGQDTKQTNLARIYYGEFSSSIDIQSVQWILIVKIGHPWERQLALPGNRGKRDSLHLVMQYLRSVVISQPGELYALSPLESAIHESMLALKVDPTMCNYLFTIDGDTSVHKNAPSILLDVLERNPSVSAAFGSLHPLRAYASLGSMVASLHNYWRTHVCPSVRQGFSATPPINTAFVAYRLQTCERPAVNNSPDRAFRRHATVYLSPTDSAFSIDDKEQDHHTGLQKSNVLEDNDRLFLLHQLVMRRLGKAGAMSAYEKNLFLLGQDAHFSTSLMLARPECTVKYVPGARAFTHFPTSIVLASQWLIRQWIAHLFVRMDQLYALNRTLSYSGVIPWSGQIRYLIDRAFVLSSIILDLLMPWIFVTAVTILVFGSIHLWSYFGLASAIGIGSLGVQIVLLALVGRISLVLAMLVSLNLCLPLIMVFVPVIGMMSVTCAVWVDQWPAEGAESVRRPGALMDPVPDGEP